MRIYFAGIGGVGIGPLAIIAKEAGYDVAGYDVAPGLMTEELRQKGVPFTIGTGLPDITAAHAAHPLDWVVATSAIPVDDPVLQFARAHRIRVSKRDELLNYLIRSRRQALIAVTGTHGKTTVTAMITWLFSQFDIPEGHSIGTIVSFASNGSFSDEGRYFIYEADEYDRNMLKLHPQIAVLTSIDYDHPDTYPTPEDYKQAFREFVTQSDKVFAWKQDLEYLNLKPGSRHNTLMTVDPLQRHEKSITLPGAHNRHNALLACAVFGSLFAEIGIEQIIAAINRFPGTQRRFERLAENIYTDYGHHPAEIAATLQLASELSKHVVLVYQPHQNIRQHEMIDDYGDCFNQADKVYWLPTYLTREDPQLPVLTPKQLIARLDNPSIAEPALLDDNLIQIVRRELDKHSLVLFMGAGDIDQWARGNLDQLIPQSI